MATIRRLRAALARHPEIHGNPVVLQALQRRFQSMPPTSVEALLLKMGPFAGATDGFRFNNSFPITDEQSQELRRRYRVVTDAVVGTVVGQVRDILGGIRADVPLRGTVGLPAVVIDAVVGEVTTTLAGGLVDDIAAAAIPGDFGRCGGMAFAGYDFYLAGWQVDERLGTSPPAGGVLGDYIFARLLDSIELNAGTFVDWVANLHYLPKVSRVANLALGTAVGSFGGPIGIALGAVLGSQIDVFDLGGAKVLLERSKAEWTKLKQRLDDEAAWPLGLIYDDNASPFGQHTLLAVGYAERNDGTGTIIAWDNNAPNMDRSLDLDFRGDELRIGTWSHPLRGFFLVDYSPKLPPESLHLP